VNYTCHRLYVSGGYIRGTCSATIEYTDDGSSFHYLPPMPEAKHMHLMSVLENGDVFLVGGFQTSSCFLYESKRKEWKKYPNMTEKRYGT
jgi:hypothetical protein